MLTGNTFIEKLATHSGQIKLFVYLSPFIILSIVYYNLYVEADTQRRVKERVADNAAYSASSFIYKTFGSATGEIEIRPTLKRALLNEAKASLGQLSEAGPAIEPLRQRGLAAVLIESSALNQANGNATEAAKDAGNAVGILRTLAATTANNFDIRFDLATAYDRLGDGLASNEAPTRAVDAYTRSHELFEELAAFAAASEKLQRNLATSAEKIAMMFVAARSFEQAEKSVLESCKIRSDLLSRLGARVDLRLDVARCHRQIGQVLSIQKKYERAQDELGQALILGEQIPVTVGMLVHLAETHQRLGELYEQMKTKEESADWEHHFRKAVEINRQIASVQSDRLDATTSYVASIINLGFLLAKTGRSEEALSLYREGLDHVSAIGADYPELMRVKARMLAAVGDVKRDAGHLDDARVQYAIAIKTLEGLAAASLAPPALAGRPDEFLPKGGRSRI